MVFGLFRKQDLVTDVEVRWLFDSFAWCLRNFDAQVFFGETRLVVPSNDFFPGRETSVEGMARLIFEHVQGYASMGHWPVQLVDQTVCAIPQPGKVEIRGALRGAGGKMPEPKADGPSLAVGYDPDLLGNPEALIAGYAHALAHYLGQTATEPPPGGATYWPQVTEVLAVFMGFGLMFANSAFNVPVRSCGNCGGPAAERRSYLTQYESTYALAIFCLLKGVSSSAVLRHLKNSLRPFYRKCVKDLAEKQVELAGLRAISRESGGSATTVIST